MKMGLGMGGRIEQEIYDDPFSLGDWSQEEGSRCFIHLVDGSMWKDLTGHTPHHRSPTANDYSNAGLPWFSYYDEGSTALPPSKRLGKLKSITNFQHINDVSASPKVVKNINPKRSSKEVREGSF